MSHYTITTPEQVRFRFEIAGLGTRGLAWAIDQLILLALTVIVLVVAMCSGSEFGITLFALTRFVLDFGYWMFFEMRCNGQTPGKRRMRIRVIPTSGGQLRFADALLRTLLRVLDSPSLIPFVGVVGAAVAACDSLHRRLGDWAADTLVVRVEHVELPATALTQQARVNTFAADLAMRRRILARVSVAERDLILDLMVRRDELAADVRAPLFERAASHFRGRYGLPDDIEHLSDEQTVLNLALVMQSARFTE
jgi:uncharacterized RDD family membrane protein YckC